MGKCALESRGKLGVWRWPGPLSVSDLAEGQFWLWKGADMVEENVSGGIEQNEEDASETEMMVQQEVSNGDCSTELESEAAEGAANVFGLPITAENFGQAMDKLQLSESELFALRRSFELLLSALGGDRDRVGDAIYGAKTTQLIAIKESFITPRAVLSLALFNGFRVLGHKSEDPEELRLFVETMAFKHLGLDITLQRVTGVIDVFTELMKQNIQQMPPGSVLAWKKLLIYTGSCFRYVNTTFGERLKVIQADWKTILTAAEHDDDVNHSFSGMCAFSMGIMGEEAEGWMQELLQVFPVLVDRISKPASLLEECDLLAINMNNRFQNINFDKFKPVMLAALRSLLPKCWSTTHETAWEWLWFTISRNLVEATKKVKAYKLYNAHLFSTLKEEQFEQFRTTIYTDFFSKCSASQEWFKQSQTRLRYIADRVLRSSYDMYQKPKEEMMDELSALGLRHVGYGVPIELFAPFTDSCVEVMKHLIADVAKDETVKLSLKVDATSATAHGLQETDATDMMLEGFRWSIGLVARVLMRTITEGSTSVMQSINANDANLLIKSLIQAPRCERSNLLLRVRVGTQQISPLHWALRSGAHTAAKTMLEDLLTIRADRDNYYYGVDDIFRLQPDVVEDILLEAPLLATTLMDGMIWRSHKTQAGLRPVIYYLKNLVQDMDENKTFSRALISFVKYDNPKTIMHPILVFVLDLIWTHLAKKVFFLDRVLTMVSFVVFLLATCLLKQPSLIQNPAAEICLTISRILVYSLGFVRLLYWHTGGIFRSYRQHDTEKVFKVSVPRYLMRGNEVFSLTLMFNMIAMMTVEPLFHCLGVEASSYECKNWTDEMSYAYQVFTVLGIFLYAVIVADIANISIELCEFKVLCSHALKQVVLCIGVVTCILFVFSFAIGSMTREAALLSGQEFSNLGHTLNTLMHLAVGTMDKDKIHGISRESPVLLVVIVIFMLVVYSFFFNLLVSQLCGVYAALAADIQGYAMLARAEAILDTLKAVPMKKWRYFITSLALDQRVDFEEGDIGLAGGIKTWEPALAHPITQDQIVRFGGDTDPSLPWPHQGRKETSMEKMVQKTIQKSLQQYLGKKHGGTDSTTDGSHSSSSHGESI
eukprot:Skav218848  [mRNA]  locus=scaffold2397:54135:62539:+ [translate_table: standard]